MPVPRSNPAISNAPGAAAAAPPLGLELPSELPSFSHKDVATLLEQLNSDMGLRTQAAAAAGGSGGDQQQQQDQDKAAGRSRGASEGGDLGE